MANAFGWNIADIQGHWQTHYFNRFSVQLPCDCIAECSHQGQCDDDVEYWAKKIERPDSATPEVIAAELKEYGAWDAEQLADDKANWERIVWLAACDLKENRCKHESTNGTIDCPECGCKASQFIADARDWMDSNDGITADDPGYFDTEK